MASWNFPNLSGGWGWLRIFASHFVACVHFLKDVRFPAMIKGFPGHFSDVLSSAIDYPVSFFPSRFPPPKLSIFALCGAAFCPCRKTCRFLVDGLGPFLIRMWAFSHFLARGLSTPDAERVQPVNFAPVWGDPRDLSYLFLGWYSFTSNPIPPLRGTVRKYFLLFLHNKISCV